MECFLVICGREMFGKEGCFRDDFVDGLNDGNVGEEESHRIGLSHTTAIGVPNILFFVFGTFQSLFFYSNHDYKTSYYLRTVTLFLVTELQPTHIVIRVLTKSNSFPSAFYFCHFLTSG